jgi:hypothetical protein
MDMWRGETIVTQVIKSDRKLNWNKQVETSSEKATNRLKILKRLAGTKWGSSRRTLNTTYTF